MSAAAGSPDMKRMFLFTVGLLIVSLMLPVGLAGRIPRLYLAAQAGLSIGALSLAILIASKRRSGIVHITADLAANVTVFAASVAVIQAFYPVVPLIPLLLFVVYPYTMFSRRLRYFWIPALLLFAAAAGRYLLTLNPGLVYWTAIFLLYSAVLGARMSRDRVRIEYLRSQLERINSDAREMMGRIEEDGFAEIYDRIRGEEAARAIALDEDDYLHRLLAWGCRVFNARTGILLVPDEKELGFYRTRAAVHRGVEILEGLVPADKGFIHITRERDGTLCVSDASSARKSLSFYPEDTQVGSFLVKIVMDPKWGRDAESGMEPGKIRCVLYFDSEKINTMSLDDVTAKRLDEFGALILKAMNMAGRLQKLTKEVSSRDAISRYARGLTGSLIPQDIAKMALDAVVDAIPKCDGAAVMLHENGLSIVAYDGYFFESLKDDTIHQDDTSQMGMFLRRFDEFDSGQVIGDANFAEVVIDYKQTRKTPFFRKGERLGDIISFAAIPCYMMGTENPLKAAIAVVSSKEKVFGKEELEELRTIAGMMAPALDNAFQHKRVDEQSRTDGLTGLLNRRTFQIILDGKINNVTRGYFQSLALIMVDGDRFKSINDTYGHSVGDEVLIEIAKRLKAGVRKNDAVARYGGEEFTIVLDNAGEKEANEIAEKMRQSIHLKPFMTSAGKISVTASFGFTIHEGRNGVGGKQIIEEADRALYHAKESGRDRVVSYNDIETSKAGFEPVEIDTETVIQEGKTW